MASSISYDSTIRDGLAVNPPLIASGGKIGAFAVLAHQIDWRQTTFANNNIMDYDGDSTTEKLLNAIESYICNHNMTGNVNGDVTGDVTGNTYGNTYGTVFGSSVNSYLTTIKQDTDHNSTYYISLVNKTSGSSYTYVDSDGLYYNPNTNTISLKNINVTNNVTVGGYLNNNTNITTTGYIKSATLQTTGDATVTGNLTVNGNTTLGDAETNVITIKGDTTFNADVDINKTLNVDGDVTFGGKLSINDTTVLKRDNNTTDTMFYARRGDLNKGIGFGIGTSNNRGIYDETNGWILKVTTQDHVTLNGASRYLQTQKQTSTDFYEDLYKGYLKWKDSNTVQFVFTDDTNNIYTFYADEAGNASTADKLKTARNIKLTGSVTGNANFDGSGNIEISTTTNHTHAWATDITNAIVYGNEFNIGSSTESLNRFWFNFRGKDDIPFADDKLINDYLMGSGNGGHATTANKYAYVTARGFKVGGQEDKKYVVWSNGTTSALVASDIPNLAASKITSGTFNTARIPSLAASKITSGTFDIARIPTGTTASTVALGNHTHDYISTGTQCIELNTVSILKNYGGFIDFHFRNNDGDWTNSDGQVYKDANGNKTCPDYTSRIIEDEPGQITINSVKFKNNEVTATKFVGALNGNADTATNANKVKINNSIGNGGFPLIFTNTARCGNPAYDALYTNATNNLNYNPSTNTLVTGSINITGTASSTAKLMSDASTNMYVNIGGNIPLVIKYDDTDKFVAPGSSFSNTVNLGTSARKWKTTYATTFYGDLYGPIQTTNTSTDASYYLSFVNNSSTGMRYSYVDSNLYYNPSTNVLTTTQVNANLNGAVQTTATSTSATYYISFVNSSSTGMRYSYVDSNLYYNPSTNTLTGGKLLKLIDSAGTAGKGAGIWLQRANADDGTYDWQMWIDSGTLKFSYNNGSWYDVFSAGAKDLIMHSGSIITPTNDNEGILPASNNYGQIGSETKKFYRMYASTFIGNLNGSATNATFINVASASDKNASYYIQFVNATTGIRKSYTDSHLLYNPGTNILTAQQVDTKLNGPIYTYVAGTNLSYYITFVNGSTAGMRYSYVDSNLIYNPSTNTLTGGKFVGYIATDRGGSWSTSAHNGAASVVNDHTGSGGALVCLASMTAKDGRITIGTIPRDSSYFYFSYHKTGNTSVPDKQMIWDYQSNILKVPQVNGNLYGAVQTISSNNTDASYYISFVNDSSSGMRYSYVDSGLYYNPNTNVLTTTGHINATNGFYETSDERLKDFQEDIEVNFSYLRNIPKKYYSWKDDATYTRHIGTSAQEVQKYYPELVNGDENSYLTMNYDKLSVVALKAIDVLHEEVTELKKENAELKERLARLEELILNR